MREAATGDGGGGENRRPPERLATPSNCLGTPRSPAHDSVRRLSGVRSLTREERAGLMEEKDRRADAQASALRRRRASSRTPSSRNKRTTHAVSAEDFEHFKGAMLRFLLAEDYATQQAMMPVLAALLRFDEDEAVKVGRWKAWLSLWMS